MLLPGDNNDSIELEVMTAIQPLWLLMPLSEQAKKRVTVLAELLILIVKGKLGWYNITDVRKSIAGT